MNKKVLATVGTTCIAAGLIFSSSGMMFLGCILLLGATLAHAAEGR